MTVTIVEYDPQWPEAFGAFAERIRQTLPRELLVSVEHVGSTAVPGLAAKSIIDLNVIIPTAADLPAAIAHLGEPGYVYEGDLGIAGRDAFRWPPGTTPHHLYVCAQDSDIRRDQIWFRDYLRVHRDEARRYEALKRDLAGRFPMDRRAYAEGKTDYVRSVLEKARQERPLAKP